MASLPRIITVDPTGSIPQQVRAAFDLMDRLVVQIDVPGAAEALEEMKRGGISGVIAAWEPGDGMQGWELAGRLRQIDAEVRIILLGDYGDTEMDEEMLSQSPFVYLKRPFDIPQLINVLKAVLDKGDIKEAIRLPAGPVASAVTNMGPVPSVNDKKATDIVSSLMRDLNAMAILLATREGEVLLEHGTLHDINRDEITRGVIKAVLTTIDLRDIIGGNTTALQFYDGDAYDVYLISVGLHHFLLILFEGTRGGKEFGAVSRYGRRASEDLIGVIGAPAWFIQRFVVEPTPEPEVRRKSVQVKTATQEMAIPELQKANLSPSTPEPEPVVESAMPQLEAIAAGDFDADALFGMDFDEDGADDLFNLDAMEDLASDEGKKGTLDWDRARELGLLND